jgi:hypothetical protein
MNNMQKSQIGTIVYAKKHNTFFRELPEKPFIITAHIKLDNGNLFAVLDTGERVSFGELTDIPCTQMECGNCKWHKRRITTYST